MRLTTIILYDLFIRFYLIAVHVASIWNEKAKLWVKGREKFPDFKFETKSIWMHCASLGEFEQGRPLLEKIKKEFPQYPVVLSFFSPSGYESAKNFKGADQIIYLPADTILNAKKLITQINPAVVFWVKYEYWYHYLTEIKKRDIPLLLVSAIFRESQPFFKFYGGFWRRLLHSFTHFFVQNNRSLELLQSLGFAENSSVSGDTRFDRVIDIAQKNSSIEHINEFKGDNRLIVAGSTWKEDIELLAKYSKQRQDLTFIIAPHEINKDSLIETEQLFSEVIFYSDLAHGKEFKKMSNIMIVDNIGMLSRLYAYADITYVGGGFNKSGIHNTLEAAVYGKPVIFGPYYQKFSEAVSLVKIGGGYSIRNYRELQSIMDLLLNNQNKLLKSGKASLGLVYDKQGATEKIFRYVKENLLLTS